MKDMAKIEVRMFMIVLLIALVSQIVAGARYDCGESLVCYHLDENVTAGENTTFVRDFSGNLNNGATYGDTKFNTTFGVCGGSAVFDGSGDSITSVNTVSLDYTKNLTVSAWIYTGDSTPANNKIVLAERNGLYVKNFQVGIYTDGKMMFDTYVGCAGTGYTLYSNDMIDENDWNFAVWRLIVGKERAMFLDGAFSGNTSNYPNLGNCVQPISVSGNIFNSQTSWDGLIDEVRVFDYALNESEILSLYQEGVICINGTTTTTTSTTTSTTLLCYQEFVNVSTGCGGLNTGTYFMNGSACGSSSNWNDGDWNTYSGNGGAGCNFYSTYTKPSNVTTAIVTHKLGAVDSYVYCLNTTSFWINIWSYSGGGNLIRNSTVPDACLIGNLSLYFTGTEYDFHEEGVYWSKITTTTTTSTTTSTTSTTSTTTTTICDACQQYLADLLINQTDAFVYAMGNQTDVMVWTMNNQTTMIVDAINNISVNVDVNFSDVVQAIQNQTDLLIIESQNQTTSFVLALDYQTQTLSWVIQNQTDRIVNALGNVSVNMDVLVNQTGESNKLLDRIYVLISDFLRLEFSDTDHYNIQVCEDYECGVVLYDRYSIQSEYPISDMRLSDGDYFSRVRRYSPTGKVYGYWSWTLTFNVTNSTW